jgi:hypothetical protein
LIVRQHAENRPLKKPARDERARAREIRGLHASHQGTWRGSGTLGLVWPSAFAATRRALAAQVLLAPTLCTRSPAARLIALRKGRGPPGTEKLQAKCRSTPLQRTMREVMQGFTRMGNSFQRISSKPQEGQWTSQFQVKLCHILTVDSHPHC